MFLVGAPYLRTYISLTPSFFNYIYKRDYVVDYIFSGYLGFSITPKSLEYRTTPSLGPLEVL
jgi:hypothetical protein